MLLFDHAYTVGVACGRTRIDVLCQDTRPVECSCDYLFAGVYPQRMATVTDEDRVISRIGKAITRGKCILFLGAGAHAPPPEGSLFEYPDEQRPPIGSTLSRQLAEECGFAEDFPNESTGNLMRVALAYELSTSRGELVDEIEYAVKDGKSPSPALSALAKLDFSLIITTNYDQLFEQALIAAGKEPRVSVYKPSADAETDELLDPTAQSPIIYKLHGDIAERESLVVTDEDYIQFVMRMADKGQYDPIPLSLKAPLTTWSTLFVGYSLIDYNLRLLLKTLRSKIDAANLKPMFSVDYHPDPLIVDVWGSGQHRRVEFIAQDIWSFVPLLYKQVVGEELAP